MAKSKTYNLEVEKGRVVPIRIRKHHWAKKISLKVSSSGTISLVLPLHTPYNVGKLFAMQQSGWLRKHLPALHKNSHTVRRLPTAQEKKIARQLVKAKLEQWNEFYGFHWTSITIRNQTTRWGSCSPRGTLSFNWRIIMLPTSLQDYLIIHELCHLEEANHQKEFWQLVDRALPSYRQSKKELANIDIANLNG